MEETETLDEKSTKEALEAWNAWQPKTNFERQLKEEFDFNKAMELVIDMRKCTANLEKQR